MAEDFPGAQRVLAGLTEDNPDARVLTLMAAAERGQGASDSVVQGWLGKALTAPRGPQWVCQNCSHVHGEWAPVCSQCEAFDTLSWQTPPSAEVTSSTGAHMLPMIVGAIEDKQTPETVAEGEILDVDGSDKPVAQTG